LVEPKLPLIARLEKVPLTPPVALSTVYFAPTV
jgi:hypothetical protein